MPRGDGTGPAGMGPMTGRGAGFCAESFVPGYLNRYPGGAWFGRGAGGRGRRNWYYATGISGWARARMGYPAWGGEVVPYPHAPELTPDKEAEMLKKQAQLMQEEMGKINERIKELEKLAEKKEK